MKGTFKAILAGILAILLQINGGTHYDLNHKSGWRTIYFLAERKVMVQCCICGGPSLSSLSFSSSWIIILPLVDRIIPLSLKLLINLMAVSVVVPTISAISWRVNGKVDPSLSDNISSTPVIRCSTLSPAKSRRRSCAFLSLPLRTFIMRRATWGRFAKKSKKSFY